MLFLLLSLLQLLVLVSSAQRKSFILCTPAIGAFLKKSNPMLPEILELTKLVIWRY